LTFDGEAKALTSSRFSSLRRYCPVWADRAEFQSLAKAWIPPNAGNVECWSKGERPIADYIKAWFKDADPSRVIRMATIQNVRNPNIVHLTVPEALVDAKELNWKIECRASPRNIPNFFVRYGQFANVKGTQRGSGDNWRYPDHFWWPSQNTELLWGPLWDWTKPGRGKGKGRNEPDLEFEHQDS
jgi:hypothetical protein